MTHDHIQWALYGFMAGTFACGITADLIALWDWWRARA